jgi:hypothetical protein
LPFNESPRSPNEKQGSSKQRTNSNTMPNYRLKLDVTKLDKSAFFNGAKGTYVDITLWENDQPDEYGNTHSAKQDMGKDRRGEKTPYVGNAKPFGASTAGRDVPASEATKKHQQAKQNAYAPEEEDDGSIPF